MEELDRLFATTEFFLDLDDGEEDNHPNLQYSLLGKLYTEKVINYNAMIGVFRRSWGLTKGMDFKVLENGILFFRFECEADLKKVENRGPWPFSGQILLTKRWEPELSPNEVHIEHVSLWIQILGLPVEWYTPTKLEKIGATMGEVCEVDVGDDNGYSMKTARVRVRYNIRKSLSPGIWIKRKTRDPLWVSFKFERLPHFCCCCGCMGHNKKFCSMELGKDGSFNVEEGLYGKWLRAEFSEQVPNNTRLNLLKRMEHKGDKKEEAMAIVPMLSPYVQTHERYYAREQRVSTERRESMRMESLV